MMKHLNTCTIKYRYLELDLVELTNFFKPGFLLFAILVEVRRNINLSFNCNKIRTLGNSKSRSHAHLETLSVKETDIQTYRQTDRQIDTRQQTPRDGISFWPVELKMDQSI